MGKKSLLWFICIAVVLSFLAVPALAAESAREDGTVSSYELIENEDKYNEKKVVYRGEAIGDILKRGESAWITVNDDNYADAPKRKYDELQGTNSGIGVYGPVDDIDEIRFLGSYDTQGDLVEVRGTFYKASAEHGGDTCIVADEVNVLRSGRHINDNRMRIEFIVACAMLVICLALGTLVFLRRKRGFGR